MAVNNPKLQPGTILHEVIIGCLKASGTTFEKWCRENDIHLSTARNATHGQSGGDRGKAILDGLIAAAGPEHVRAAYRSRIEAHAAQIAAKHSSTGAAA